MTNLEAIQAKIANNYPLDDASFEAALIESGVDGTAVFTGGKAFDRSMVNLIVILLGSASRISEGGYTVEINTQGLNTLLNWYLNRWGWRNPLSPVIRDRSRLW